jgi:TonB-dependent receptor
MNTVLPRFIKILKTGAWVLTVLYAVMVFVAPVAAQSAKGILTGRAVDTAGAVLQGARVEVEPGGRFVSTGEIGQFVVTDLAPGDFKVTISYVGFTPFVTDVKVLPGQSRHIDAVLKVNAKAEEITVTAERAHGEAEAINRTREADNIIQVLPVEVITSLPNTNIADAVGRLPSVTLERDEGEGKYVQIRGTEPRLSNVTVNGVNVPSPEGSVRQIKLDTIPANLVESVEVNKTLSANQDGDAIGGSVNLVTKTAEEKPTVYLNGFGGYTPILTGRSLYEADGTIGQRFGANKKLGILIGASYDWNGRGIDDVEPSPATVQCDPGPTGCLNPSSNAPNYAYYKGYDLREYQYYRSRYGAAGSVDYKLSETSGLYIRGIYSHFNNFGNRWVYSPSFGTPAGDNGAINNGDGSTSFNVSIRRPVDVIGSLEAGGKHVFTKWVLSYDLSVSRSSEEDHGYSNASFAVLPNSPLNAINYTLNTSNPNVPKFVSQNANIFDSTQYYLTGSGVIDVSRTYSPQLNLQVGTAVARNYSAWGHFSTFEFGFKFRNAHKFQNTVDDYYDAPDPTTIANGNDLQMSNFVGTFTNPNYYFGEYGHFAPTVDWGKVQTFFNANKGPAGSPFTCGSSPPPPTTALLPWDCAQTQQNTLSNDYDLVEQITAGYFMNTTTIGKFRLQAGLRFEATNEGLQGYLTTFDPNTGIALPPSNIKVNSSYLDPLPSVQLRYQLPHDAALRAAYGRGIARPNFADLPPYFNHNGPNNEIDIGNPYLKPTHANNYDILYEQFLKPLGLLQGGFFVKQLSDPIYEGVRSAITTDVYGPQYVGWDLVQPLNGKNAILYGVEIAYQQHLTFLPGFLKGVGISANYSHTYSKTDGVPGRTDEPPLQRQAPNTWNISPTYDRNRLSMRLGLSYNGANIFQYNYTNLNSDGTPNPQPLGLKGPNGDVYLYSHFQVDLQGSYRVYKGLQFVASVLNLTNEAFGFYQGSPIYPIQREYYSPSYSFGLRYTLANESK